MLRPVSLIKKAAQNQVGGLELTKSFFLIEYSSRDFGQDRRRKEMTFLEFRVIRYTAAYQNSSAIGLGSLNMIYDLFQSLRID